MSKWPEYIVGGLALVAWFVLFIGGIAITTTPFFHHITDNNVANNDTRQYLVKDKDQQTALADYKDQLAKKIIHQDYDIDSYSGKAYFRQMHKSVHPAYCFLMIALFYTVTNVGLLCLLSSLLGTVARLLHQRATPDPSVSIYQSKDQSVGSEAACAILGGLVVYLIFFSGAYTLFGFQFSPPNPGQVTEVNEARLNYAKLAMLASLVSFIDGYRPFVIARILERIGVLVGSTASPSSARVDDRATSATGAQRTASSGHRS